MRILFLLSLIIICNLAIANDSIRALEILKKIELNYDTDSYMLELDYNLYQSKIGGLLLEKAQMFYFQKDASNYYSRYNGSVTVCIHDTLLVKDDLSKSIILQKNDEKVDVTSEYFQLIHKFNYELIDAYSVAENKVVLSFVDGCEYAWVSYNFDENYYLTSVEICPSQKVEMTHKNDVIRTECVLQIHFNLYRKSFHKHSLLSFNEYLNISSNNISLASTYKNFRLINLLK